MKTEVCKSFGMRPVGGFGVRGFRVHCDCGYLSEVKANFRTTTKAAFLHRKEHRERA